MLPRLRRIALLPAIDALTVAPEILLRLYTGTRREIVAHQRQGLGNRRRAPAVGPVASEHDTIFTQGRDRPAQPHLRRGDDIPPSILVPDLRQLDKKIRPLR